MTQEQIEGNINKYSTEPVFEIRFKSRNPIKGLFIKTVDFGELSRKNLWRVVRQANIEEYKRTNNADLVRIFNGTAFSRLEAQKPGRK
jgi:hypothetical protein